ncbi:MAG: phosphopantothenoylcysteine decarboxylase [Spirochaetia bacterium]|nr:phosphopantothenoylcysteine decarboxylase [Spirochaetia bacterium]
MKTEEYTLIVTSGPTREWIDPVRFISNPASGRTGWHLADAGKKKFHQVIYISGPGHPSFQNVDGAQNLPVESTEEMAEAVHQNIGSKSILFMTAAPADYRPARTEEHKIKKENKAALEIKLVPTTDILMSISGVFYENFYRVGFAAETDNIIENAITKMVRKNLDFICANTVNKEQIGFGDHANTLTVIDRKKNKKQIGPAVKEKLAEELLSMIINHLPDG